MRLSDRKYDQLIHSYLHQKDHLVHDTSEIKERLSCVETTLKDFKEDIFRHNRRSR